MKQGEDYEKTLSLKESCKLPDRDYVKPDKVSHEYLVSLLSPSDYHVRSPYFALT